MPAAKSGEEAQPEGEPDPVPPVHAGVAYVRGAEAGDYGDGEEVGGGESVGASEGKGAAAGDPLDWISMLGVKVLTES